MNENNNDVKIVAFDAPKSSTKRTLKNKPRGPLKPQEKIKSETEISNENKTGIKKFSKLFLIIGIIALVVITVSVCLAVFLSKKNKKKTKNENGNGISDYSLTPNTPEDNELLLKPIYKLNNTVGDLKRINVQQTSYKNMTINGQTTEFLVYRNTIYDIYIMSVESPDEKNKNFYTNKYTASINVVKECYSYEKENCTQDDYIDFSKNEDNNNLRHLEEITEFKDIPVPLCLFNFTDNDAITSFKCPESLPESKKYEMILDLYFFRPPAIERPEMDNPLKNITFETKSIVNGTFTRERNSGICDVKNPLKTHCTTDMNTTTDIYDNLVKYDEIAFSNFSSDENNSYVKYKISHLKDISDQTKYLNKENHKKQLKYIIEKLEPYIKYDEYFSTEDFQELYSIIKGDSSNNQKSYRRNLNEIFSGINPYIKEESLFFTEINGVQINLKLRNDIGIDKEFMTASSQLSLDDTEKELATKSEQTHLNKILEKLIILSKAGNSLASELYDQIKQKLNDITQNVKLTIKSLNDLIVYEDLVSVFDSTLSFESVNILPTNIISQSEHLFKSLNNKLVNTTEITEYKKTLNKNIYNFLYESHNLVNGLLEKIKELGIKLGSRKGKLTEIATYYLNNTSNSFTSIVSKAENILKNYYINEKVLISNEINSIVKSFEENIKNSVKKEIDIIENIKTKLENGTMTISLGDEDDAKNVISYLSKSINTISDIISTYKNKIESSLDLKSSGYFITNNEIESIQNRVNETIKEAKENVKKADNDELIDKVYDEIMSNFRQNFTDIKNYMNNKRDENFIMDEDVLKNNKFTKTEKEKISVYLNTLRSNISNEIINEINSYNSEVMKKINNLVSMKKESLNQLISNVDSLFSEPILVKLSNLYKNTFDNSFELIKKQISNNKQLSYQYLDYLLQVLSNDTEIIVHIDPYFRYKMRQLVYYHSRYHYSYVTQYKGYVKARKIANAYLRKYNLYTFCFDSSEDYINNQMYIDLFYQYKNLIIKLKALLQSVKNNKFSDKYSDLTELTFVNNNIRIIDNLYTRLDKYFSESLFNKNYLTKFNTFKQNEVQEIEKIKQELISKNKSLTNDYEIIKDKANDFCASYTQVVTHTCTGGAVWTFNDSSEICVDLNYYSNNHNQLTSLSVKSENNLLELETEFNNFYYSLNKNINEYNNALTTLKNEIISLENNAMSKNNELSSLNEINIYVNSILAQKYGNILVKDSYDFYKKNIDNKLENLLSNISEKWIESFNITESEIRRNKNKFKNQVHEFYYMAYIYIDLIEIDMIYDYTDSIITQQKNEVNYTISYYYNYLYTSVNKTYQYIIGKISTYNDGFNNILNYRKSQVIEKYNEILQIIKNSENIALNEKKQINLLLVSNNNFFKLNTMILDKIDYLKKKLVSLTEIMEVDAYSIGGKDTADSISARLYLEISNNGKIVQELTDSINRNNFVNLNQEKFKELIDNNIIFDQENLMGCVNAIISQSTLEISTRYQRIRETYINQLENEINYYFTKESLVEKIYLIYKNGINNLDENSRNEIISSVNEILEVLINHIKSESNRLSTTISYNKNYETINQTIKNYKVEIFNKVKNEMTNLFETLKKNIYDKIYTDYLEKGLNEYLNEIKNAISNNERYKEYKTVGASYKIGEDIVEIAEDLANQYKFIAREAINNTVIKSDYYNALNLEGIEQIINERIESAFTSYLLPALKKYAIYEVNVAGFDSYDLPNDIKNDIDSKINENVQKIKNKMITTKGQNYDFKLDFYEKWKVIDFTNIRKVLDKNSTDIEVYFIYEIDEEKKMFNTYIKNSIKENFNKMLDNFIISFGNKFFERIGEYNLLNKIDNLFNNLEYSSYISFFYFVLIFNGYFDYKYQRDLKFKVIKLNDIDLIIQQNKGVILETFADKIDGFIHESGNYLIEQYSLYMQKDEYNIEFTNMNKELKDLIKLSLFNSKNDMENYYKNSLQNHLKNPLIEKYEKYIKETSKEIIKTINEERQDLSSQINEHNLIDSEEDLIEINEKINMTLAQIDNYNKHFKQFKISENIKQFLSSYGDNSINPLFKNITSLINEASKNIILKNLEENSDNYVKKLNIASFNNKANESYSYLNKEYINPISKQILLYDAQNYESKLNDKKEEISRRKRNLENLNTEDDTKNIYCNKVADKPLDDTFSKLLNTIDNIESDIDSLKEFNDYDKLIAAHIKDINISVLNSGNLIVNYNFDENMTNILNNKLSYLKNISLSYYNNINNSYSILRNYIKNSIKKINDDLKKCANSTYEAFANNYYDILNDEKNAFTNKKYSEIEDELNTIEYNSTNQNSRTNFKIDITNLKHYSEFKFEIKYEEDKNILKPKLFARITNKNTPSKMIISSYEENGYDGRIGQKIEVDFNDANYSTIINFDTKATNINVTTLTKFEGYSYSSVPFIWEITPKCTNCITMRGRFICFPKKKCSKENEYTSRKQSIIIDTKEINNTEIIEY